MFNLKDVVRDTITGFEGVVTGIAQYVGRETVYQLENVDNTGRPIEWWFPENRLVRISGI